MRAVRVVFRPQVEIREVTALLASQKDEAVDAQRGWAATERSLRAELAAAVSAREEVEHAPPLPSFHRWYTPLPPPPSVPQALRQARDADSSLGVERESSAALLDRLGQAEEAARGARGQAAAAAELARSQQYASVELAAATSQREMLQGALESVTSSYRAETAARRAAELLVEAAEVAAAEARAELEKRVAAAETELRAAREAEEESARRATREEERRADLEEALSRAVKQATDAEAEAAVRHGLAHGARSYICIA